MTDEIKDANLVVCTLKKSASVCYKILCIICVLCGIVGAYAISVWAFGIAVYLMSLIALPTIPLWVIVAAIIVLSVILYSFAWCINRELTKEDWKSDAAIITGLWGAIAAMVFFAAAGLAAIIIPTMCALLVVVGVLPIAIVVFSVGVLSTEDDPRICTEFFGAVWNHYKVKKND